MNIWNSFISGPQYRHHLENGVNPLASIQVTVQLVAKSSALPLSSAVLTFTIDSLSDLEITLSILQFHADLRHRNLASALLPGM